MSGRLTACARPRHALARARPAAIAGNDTTVGHRREPARPFVAGGTPLNRIATDRAGRRPRDHSLRARGRPRRPIQQRPRPSLYPSVEPLAGLPIDRASARPRICAPRRMGSRRREPDTSAQVSRPGYGPGRSTRATRDERSTSTHPVGAPGGIGAMIAPAATKTMSPQKLEHELLARLGLDPSATPEDVSTAHEAVSAYLTAAPRSLRTWARVQASGADEAYALLTDPAALARAVALVGAGARPAVLPGEPATPPARRDTPAPTPVAIVPAVTAGAAGIAAPRGDENGRRIVSDDEIDALLAEVDPTARPEIVGT